MMASVAVAAVAVATVVATAVAVTTVLLLSAAVSVVVKMGVYANCTICFCPCRSKVMVPRQTRAET